MNEPKVLPALNDECVARARRVETKVTKICEHLGIDGTPGKIRMTLVNATPPIIELTNLDVSFGDVLLFLKQRGIKDIATITHRRALLGNIKLPEGESSGS